MAAAEYRIPLKREHEQIDDVEVVGIEIWQEPQVGIHTSGGAQIGHIERQFIMPIGVPAEIDADRGSIRLLEPADREEPDHPPGLRSEAVPAGEKHLAQLAGKSLGKRVGIGR